MALLKRPNRFESYFSPADRAFTNYVSRNPQSVLGPASAAPAPVRQGRSTSVPARAEAPGKEKAHTWSSDLPIAKPAGGKVTRGPHGPMRQYRLRHASFMVPSGEHEAEVLAGTNYVALDADEDVTFATNPDGTGLILTNLSGQPIVSDGRLATFSWARLRELGKHGIVPRGKWTAQTPRSEGYQAPDVIGRFEKPVTRMEREDKPYTMITLHHTGNYDAEGVMRLHRNDTSWQERLLRTAGSRIGLAQSYSDYADVGYHFLVDEQGRIYEGRSIRDRGAHVGGHNTGNLGIAVLGDYSNKPLNADQLRAVEFLTRAMKRHLRIVPNERGGGAQANSGFLYTHGEFDPRKRDELGGAADQLYGLGKRTQQPYRNR